MTDYIGMCEKEKLGAWLRHSQVCHKCSKHIEASPVRPTATWNPCYKIEEWCVVNADIAYHSVL